MKGRYMAGAPENQMPIQESRSCIQQSGAGAPDPFAPTGHRRSQKQNFLEEFS